MIKFVESLFNSIESLKGDNKYEVNLATLNKEINDYLKQHASDRRNKLTFLSRTSNLTSMIVSYAGGRYYLYFDTPSSKYVCEIANK